MTEAYNIDCMEYMRSLPDKAFDLAVVDPPYGIGENPKRALSRSRPTKKWKNARPVEYVGGEWDNERPNREYFSELFRVSKNQIIWGGNYFANFLKPSMGWIVWYKAGQNQNTDFSDCELAFSSFNKAAKLFDYPWLGFGAVNAGEVRIHNTQKPVALYAWIYQRYAKAGDKILDTHLGSGSSRIAAYDAGLDFVGCEIDKDYFDKEEQRFAEHSAQLNLFLTESG